MPQPTQTRGAPKPCQTVPTSSSRSSEHFQDPELGALYGLRLDANAAAHVRERLESFGGARLKDMDEAGIDFQVISHSAPSVQKLDAEHGGAHGADRQRTGYTPRSALTPSRFAGFATIPTPDPKAAADELERAVTKLGFKGAMIHGMTNGRFNDEPDFWPIYERAAAQDVPIYFHPAVPSTDVINAYWQSIWKNTQSSCAPLLGQFHCRRNGDARPAPRAVRRVR